MDNYSLAELHQFLDTSFNEEELKTLCLYLQVDYDNLPTIGKSNKARELVTYLARRGRLAELQPAITAQRPKTNSLSPTPLQLSQIDFDHLAGLLAAQQEFATSAITRRDFLEDVFAGSPRKQNILSLLNLDGTPRGVAVRVITRLMQFGQDEPGQETLGVLINKLLSYIGGGAEADFLRDLFHRYPLKGTPAASRGVMDWHGRESPQQVQEKIIGENTLRDVRILELALEASRAVVHIRTADSQGSGFLVGDRLVMTNHHVIGSHPDAHASAFTFNYQLNRQGMPAPTQTTRALPNGLFYTHPQLDVTIVEIETVPEGVSPLTLVRRRVSKDERLNIIQHPGGHYKKISMQNNFVAFADGRTLQYLTATEPGSSGSPIFNNDFLVVGIHHSGGQLLEPGTAQVYLRNAGSSLIAVLDEVQATAPAVYGRLRLA